MTNIFTYKTYIHKILFTLTFPLFLSSCDLGFPRMHVNYDYLPEGEIKESIVKSFPNNPEDDLRKLISHHLKGDNSAENITKTASKLGMICKTEKDFCEYNGGIRTKVTGLSSGSGLAKRIYHIIIFPDLGVESLKVEKQIVEHTEKGS